MTFERERTEKFDLGRIVSRTLGTIQGHFALFYALALVTSGLPSALLQMLQMATVAHAASQSFAHGALSLTIWIGALVALVIKAICQCFLISGALAVFNGRAPTLGEQLRAGLRVVLPVICIALLSYIAVGVTLVLLVVPGLIVMCMLCVAIPAAVAEGTGIIGALSRSAALTRGRRWSIFGVLLLYAVAAFVFAAVVGIFIGLLFFGGFRKTYLTAAGNPLAYVGVIISSLVSAGVTMVGAIGLAALYTELRLVKEGPQTQSLAAVFE